LTDWLYQRRRPIVISILVLISISFIVFFYGILHMGTVFTHFFYIPIILA
jgi:hypothetical protein